MLKSGSSRPNQLCMTRLMIPICGLARKIHDTVNRIDGMTSGMSESAKKMRLERRVRSLVHPRQRRAEQEGKDRRAERELHRCPEQPQRGRGPIRRGVVAEREDRVGRRRLRGAEALPEKKAKRNDGDVDREGDGNTEHDPFPVERRGDGRSVPLRRVPGDPAYLRPRSWG